MTDEIELKLDVPSSHLERARRANWLAQYKCGHAEDVRLVSVYYDTDELALRDQRAILRVRECGGRFVQTFKAESRNPGAAFGRLEWESPLSSPLPHLKHAHKKSTGGFDLKSLAGSLKPVFETIVRRHVIPIRYRGSQLELAFDRGEIVAGRRRLPIHEVEIELKHGSVDSVVEFGREIGHKLKASYGLASKGERGYALRENKTAAPISAREIVLSREMATGQAFQAIAMSCVHHLGGNRDAVVARDAEGVHQMRIGLRRLRAAISVFKKMLRGPQTEIIKKELKWLTNELALARDMDVLVDEGIARMAKSSPVPAAAEALKADILEKYIKGLGRAKRAVASERYRRLLLEIVLWVNGGKWTKTGVALTADCRQMPARRFVAKEMDHRTRKVAKRLRKVESLNPRQRHKLRISIKKLRYATGFFESLFEHRGRAIAKFSTVLDDLQSTLGQLNDIRVHRQLAKEYGAPNRGTLAAARRAFAMGELTGGEHAISRDLLEKAKRRGAQLRSSVYYWQ